jgi:hypothetical protein
VIVGAIPPGQLVDVDGHQMHLQVQGPDSGGPTVVLEAGMVCFSPYCFGAAKLRRCSERCLRPPGLAGVGLGAGARAMLRRSSSEPPRGFACAADI